MKTFTDNGLKGEWVVWKKLTDEEKKIVNVERVLNGWDTWKDEDANPYPEIWIRVS